VGTIWSALCAVVLVATAFVLTPTDQADLSCRARESVVVVTGAQGEEERASTDIATGGTLDAEGAEWAPPLDRENPGRASYPLSFRSRDSTDTCLLGGTIIQPWDHETTPWQTWHGPTALYVTQPRFQVVGTEVHNAGDGLRFAEDAEDWTVRGVRVSQVHDDCVENDYMQSGTIDDSFFDGCYVFYSARAGGPSANANGNVVTITDSLVRMQPMPHVFRGTAPGTGPLWKMSNGAHGVSTDLAVHDTIFLIEQAPSHGDLALPAYDADDDDGDTPGRSYLDPSNCSNNTIVWTGEGEMPDRESYPSECFTIVTDRAVWDEAVDAWEDAR
jgi:hypothetical protein